MPHAVFTGPIQGLITLDDGTEVDVTPAVVQVDTHERAAEVAHLIGLRYEAEGHPNVDPAQVPGGFKYVEGR